MGTSTHIREVTTWGDDVWPSGVALKLHDNDPAAKGDSPALLRSVRVLAVGDPQHQHHELFVVQVVDDAVVSDANPPGLLGPRQLAHPGWLGSLGQPVDSLIRHIWRWLFEVNESVIVRSNRF